MPGKKADTYQAEIYTIQKGDSVYGLARKIGIPYERMLEANPDLDKPQNVAIGQQIFIPLRGVHTMQKGDTFYSLARHYGLELKDLQRVNPELKDMKGIDLGAQVRVPYSLAALKTTTVRALEIRQNLEIERYQEAQRNQETAKPVAPSARHVDSDAFRPTPLRPASGKTLTCNIPDGAADNAWCIVEGRGVTSTFKNATADNRPLIVIDPGHGAYGEGSALDHGHGPANGLYEYQVIDPVATALGQTLSQAGYRVAFTRNPGEVYRYEGKDRPADPTAPPGRLASRANFAHALENQVGAPYTLFVSIHANAGTPAATGMEILVDHAVSGRGDVSNATNRHSHALADSVLRQIGGYENLKNRGAIAQQVMVLDTMEKKSAGKQPDAAILIEMGFLTNTKDAKVLDDIRRNPGDFAQRIAQGIHDYAQSRNSAPASTVMASITPYTPQ